MSADNLERLAARIDDRSLINLMMTMVKRGQKATRAGDVPAAARFEEAWTIYRAEARRRGLVE